MDSPAVSGPLNSSNIFNNFSLSKVTFRTKKAKRMNFSEIKEENDGEESFLCFSPPKRSPSNKPSLEKINLKEQFQTPCNKKLNFSIFDSYCKHNKNKNVTLQKDEGFLENQPDDEIVEVLPSIKKQGGLNKHLSLVDSNTEASDTFTPENRIHCFNDVTFPEENEQKEIHNKKQDLTNEEQVCLDTKGRESCKEKKPSSHNGSNILYSVKCKNKQSKKGKLNATKLQPSVDKVIDVFNRSVNYDEIECSEESQKQNIKHNEYKLDTHSSNVGSKNVVEPSSKKNKKKEKKRNDIDKIEDRILKKYLRKRKNDKLITSSINYNPRKLPESELKVKKKKIPDEIDVIRKLLLSNAIKAISSSSLCPSSQVLTKTNKVKSSDKKEKHMFKKHLNQVNKDDEYLKRNHVNDNIETKLKVKRKNEPNETDIESQTKLIKTWLPSNNFKTCSSLIQSPEVKKTKSRKSNSLDKVQDCLIKGHTIKPEDNFKSGSISGDNIDFHGTKSKLKRKKVLSEVDIIRKRLLLNALKTCSS